MPRKRPEATFYLGDELYQALQAFRRQLPGPPTTSSLVREAVRQFLRGSEVGERLPPARWVTETDALTRQMKTQGPSVTDDDILQALDNVEEERVRALLDHGE